MMFGDMIEEVLRTAPAHPMLVTPPDAALVPHQAAAAGMLVTPPTAALAQHRVDNSQMAVPLSGRVMPGYTVPRNAVVDYIRQSAQRYGIDPEVAVRVAETEGLNAWQSGVVKGGRRERSYGPFQLYIDGGLGNSFKRDTGLDPSDPKNWKEGIDYALSVAAKDGWRQWYGARNNGIGRWAGIGGTPTEASAQRAVPTPRPSPVGDVVSSVLADFAKKMEQGPPMAPGFTPPPDVVQNAPQAGTAPADVVQPAPQDAAAPLPADPYASFYDATPPAQPSAVPGQAAPAADPYASFYEPTPAPAAAAPPSDAGSGVLGVTRALQSGANTMLAGLPNLASAGIRSLFVTGESFDQSRQAINQEVSAAGAERPYTAIAGGALGLAGGVPALARLPGAAATALGARTAAGAAYGGAAATTSALSEKGELPSGTEVALGAGVGGAVGAVAAPVIRKAGQLVQSFTRSGRQNIALQKIAETIKQPDETMQEAAVRVQQAYTNLQARGIQKPAMAELMTEVQADDAARLLQGSRAAVIEGEAGARAIATQRQTDVSNAIQGTHQRAVAKDIEGRADDWLTRQLNAPGPGGVPVRQTPVDLRGIANIDDPLVMQLLGRNTPAFRSLAEHLDQGTPIPLQMAEDIRKLAAAAGGKNGVAENRAFYRQLADDVANEARSASPEYARSFDIYAATQKYGKGAAVGATGRTAKAADFQAAIDSAVRKGGGRGQYVREGVGPGLRTEIAQTARKSSVDARTIVDDLSGESQALRENVRAVLPAQEAERIIETGEAVAGASRSLSRAIPASTHDQTAGLGEAAMHGAIGLYHPTSYLAHRLSPAGLHAMTMIPPPAQRRLAVLLTDPNQAPAVLNYLRMRGLSRSDAGQVVANALAAAAGAKASAQGRE